MGTPLPQDPAVTHECGDAENPVATANFLDTVRSTWMPRAMVATGHAARPGLCERCGAVGAGKAFARIHRPIDCLGRNAEVGNRHGMSGS
jgi:hypothetical protein